MDIDVNVRVFYVLNVVNLNGKEIFTPALVVE